jgi:glycosyltransferase involved in cell wall biosynthesis
MIPAVSVVIATYNYGRYLAGAVESALGQTFRDFEVIVVDDGSTDDTGEVIAPYLRDPRVRYERTDHVGQPAAKNNGIGLARGRLIAFLDADDVWLPEKLEKQVALLRADPAIGVVYCRRLLIDEQGRSLAFEQPVLHRGRVLEAMFRTNFVCFSSALVDRRVFMHVGLFDESLPLAIDYDLWLRVATWYSFDYVDEPLVQYRTGHASLSRRAEERLTVAFGIMRRFLTTEGGRRLLTPTVIRQATVETHYHMALARRNRSRLAALPAYFRCLLLTPTYGPAWRGLCALFLPEALRRRLRVACGQPADWSVHKRTDDRHELRGRLRDHGQPSGYRPDVGPVLTSTEAC